MANFFDIERFSDNIAVITEQDKQVTYQDLSNVANNIGSHIKKRCLVFLVCNNCFESLAGYIGILKSKAVPILINRTIHENFFSQLLLTYKPEYIFLPSGMTSLIPNGSVIYSFYGYTLFKTDDNTEYSIHEDLALLLTTSGSTGSPKFVRQSYKNLNSNANSIAQYLEITSVDRPITTMPMSYSYGLSIINSHLLKGATIILTDATLMEKRFWEGIKNNDATTFGGVPYLYEMLEKLRFENINLPSLKYITQAGGELNKVLSEKFSDICLDKGIKFFRMYGQTEATSRMSYLPWENAHTKTNSIGKAIPGGYFWIEDDNGNIIEESDTPGELAYRGENVTLGYAQSYLDLGKEDENKGVLLTGDIAKRDEDDFYYIVGRKKRFLKMLGNRVNLDEIEQIITAFGFDCACVGTDDNLRIYITQPDSENLVLKHIAKCTGINRNRFILVNIDKFPRNDSGKIQYSALK